MRQTTPRSATPNENAGVVDAAAGIALAFTSRCRLGRVWEKRSAAKTVVQCNKVFGHERRRALKHPTPSVVVRRLRSIRRWLWGAIGVSLVTIAAYRLTANGAGSLTLPASVLVGRTAPPVAGRDVMSSRPFELLQGKWTVVTFFATWCGPCRREQPQIVRFMAEHRPKEDVNVVSVVYQDDVRAVKAFERSNGGTWPVLADTGGELAPATKDSLDRAMNKHRRRRPQSRTNSFAGQP